jgi:hypothetical protein
LKKIAVGREEIELDLEVSGEELGFTEAAPRKDIYERTFKLGFEKCPGEVGPLARKQCDDKKWRLIGMEPVSASDAGGDLPVFYLFSGSDGL